MVRGSKAYLIVFSYGKRYVEELDEFTADYPSVPRERVRKEIRDIWWSGRTNFSGYGKRIMMFTLTGKDRKLKLSLKKSKGG